MTEHPILFKGAMVRANMNCVPGKWPAGPIDPSLPWKWQMRRVIKPQPYKTCDGVIYDPAIGWRFKGGPNLRCPYGIPGDRLWVRETWQRNPFGGVVHRAGSGIIDCDGRGWKPSIHMPRWACREVPEVKRIRVERVRDISKHDALAEGIKWKAIETWTNQDYRERAVPHEAKIIPIFRELWDSINKARGYGWEKNPWIWVADYMRTVQT